MIKITLLLAGVLGILVNCIISLIQEALSDVIIARIDHFEGENIILQNILTDKEEGTMSISANIFENGREGLEIDDIIVMVQPRNSETLFVGVV